MSHVIFTILLLTALFCPVYQTKYSHLRKKESDYRKWEIYHTRESTYRLVGMLAGLATGFMGAQLYLPG